MFNRNQEKAPPDTTLPDEGGSPEIQSKPKIEKLLPTLPQSENLTVSIKDREGRLVIPTGRAELSVVPFSTEPKGAKPFRVLLRDRVSGAISEDVIMVTSMNVVIQVAEDGSTRTLGQLPKLPGSDSMKLGEKLKLFFERVPAGQKCIGDLYMNTLDDAKLTEVQSVDPASLSFGVGITALPTTLVGRTQIFTESEIASKRSAQQQNLQEQFFALTPAQRSDFFQQFRGWVEGKGPSPSLNGNTLESLGLTVTTAREIARMLESRSMERGPLGLDGKPRELSQGEREDRIKVETIYEVCKEIAFKDGRGPSGRHDGTLALVWRDGRRFDLVVGIDPNEVPIQATPPIKDGERLPDREDTLGSPWPRESSLKNDGKFTRSFTANSSHFDLNTPPFITTDLTIASPLLRRSILNFHYDAENATLLLISPPAKPNGKAYSNVVNIKLTPDEKVALESGDPRGMEPVAEKLINHFAAKTFITKHSLPVPSGDTAPKFEVFEVKAHVHSLKKQDQVPS